MLMELFFAIYYGSGVMMRNEYGTPRLFAQVTDLFALKFYLDRVLPHHPFLGSEN